MMTIENVKSELKFLSAQEYAELIEAAQEVLEKKRFSEFVGKCYQFYNEVFQIVEVYKIEDNKVYFYGNSFETRPNEDYKIETYCRINIDIDDLKEKEISYKKFIKIANETIRRCIIHGRTICHLENMRADI